MKFALYSEGYCGTPALSTEAGEWFASIFLPKSVRADNVRAVAYAVELVRSLGHEPCEYDLRWIEECREAGIDTSFGVGIDYRRIEKDDRSWLKPLPDPIIYRAPKPKITTITKTIMGVECSIDFPANGRSRKELSALFDSMMPGLLSTYITHKRQKEAA